MCYTLQIDLEVHHQRLPWQLAMISNTPSDLMGFHMSKVKNFELIKESEKKFKKER